MVVQVAPPLWRIPLTLLLAIFAPPLAPVAWILFSGSRRALYLRSGWVRWGFGIIIVSAVPLLIVALAGALGLLDDPNPIGLGLLFLAGAIIGTALLIIGIIAVGRQAS